MVDQAQPAAGASIRAIPDAATRAAIRTAAARLVIADLRPERTRLAELAQHVLNAQLLPIRFLGYAMVEVENHLWRAAFTATPLTRRLLLLPHCLRSSTACPAPVNAAGLHCAACGGCDLAGIESTARALGYRVIVAEGASAITDALIEHGCDAVLGVACLESLDRSFERVAAIGLPHIAVPLASDGCVDTTLDQRALETWLTAQSTGAQAQEHRSFLPLLRFAAGLGDAARLQELLGPPGVGLAGEIEAWSRSWLAAGGKRLRAFCVLAAYAGRVHGLHALHTHQDLAALLPLSVQRLALAVEAMHKASLVHDDLADDAETRYGRPAPHRSHGVGLAVNLGDHLLGLGYTLIAGQTELGADTVADLLRALAEAHRALCLGQGAELLARQRTTALTPLEVLELAAHKTAPAFAVALLVGLRAAGPLDDPAAITKFARHLGCAYQVLDDLDDWPHEGGGGDDVRARQPTILAAFARQAGAGEEWEQRVRAGDVAGVRALYERCGAFTQARTLAEKLRQRAEDAAAAIGPVAVTELLRFLVRLAASPRR